MSAAFDYCVDALRLNSDGVEDFFMPVEEVEIDRFHHGFSRKLLAYLHGVGIDDNRTAEAIWLARVFIGLEATSSFVAVRIAEACAARGAVAAYDGDRGMLTRVARGHEFSSSLASQLGGREFNPSFTRTWGRYARSLLRADEHARKPPILIDRRKDILCFSAEPWHKKLAHDQGSRLVISHPENWYGGFRNELNAVGASVDAATVDDVVQIAEETARDEAAIFRPHVRASLASNFAFLIGIAAAMRAAAERRRHRLPRQFWANSMGPLHNRVVGRLVRKEGGHITLFDHGSGTGWRHLPGHLLEYASIEAGLCDRFVAFGEGHVGAIKADIDAARADSKDVGSCEVVVSPVPLYDTSFVRERGTLRTGGPLRLWYVPSIYAGERHYVPPLPPDVVQVDFQVRLLRQLAELGHQVVVKPHPESQIDIPPELLNLTGAKLEDRPFEATVADIDVVILDYPQSTTFRSGIIAGVPMVVLDPMRVPFLREALKLLRGRASVLPLERDAENRRRVDSGRLAEAIADAPQLHSELFQRAYYPVC